MKKNYLSPEVEIIEIAIEDCILQTSFSANGSTLEDLYEGITLF